MRGDDHQGDTGDPDFEVLRRVRTRAETYEPMVADAEYDDSLNPETLSLHLSEGFTAEAGRFDVQWTTENCYSFHYTEPGLDFRYDRHPHRHPDAPEKHFHPPPDADDAVASCVEVEAADLVTMAVLQLWRDALDADDLSLLQQPNPP